MRSQPSLLKTILATALLLSAFGSSSHAVTSARPNIILILADDLGYGDLGCYGQKKIKTPNLDRLASEGMKFTQFYSGSTVCAPSRCALLTGKHTGHCRIRGNLPQQPPLLPEDVTIAEVLRPVGYQNCALGKWGLGDAGSTGIPRQQGFDEFFGYLTHGHAHDYTPEFLWRNEGRVEFDGNKNGGSAVYVSDSFTKAAFNFARTKKQNPQFPDRRFFIYLAYTYPHANNELGKQSGNGMEIPSDMPYTSENWPQPEKNKAAMITRMDNDIGQLLAKLKDLKIDDKTIVLFTSDNGPHKEGGVDPKFFGSSGALRGIKRDLYEGGIRVPLIARWPGTIQAGTTNATPSAFWDILPTLGELGGGKIPSGIDGISLVPSLMGKDQPQHDSLYWEFHEKGFSQAMRLGRWKAIRKGTNSVELYDLESDPFEKNDIAENHPDVVANITLRMQAERTASELWPDKPATKEAAEESPSK